MSTETPPAEETEQGPTILTGNVPPSELETTIAALTARVEALESRRTATRDAEHWLLVEARRVALARRGFSIEGGSMSRVPPPDRATWIAICERKLSRSVDELADAALADAMGAVIG